MTAQRISGLWRVALALAMLSLIMAMYVTYRQYDLTNCLAKRDAEARTRTSAIAVATDAERIADLHLLRVGTPEARAEAIAARGITDRVRAEHPAPDIEPCG